MLAQIFFSLRFFYYICSVKPIKPRMTMEIYTYESNLSNIPTQDLEQQRTETINRYDARKEEVLIDVSELIDKYVPGYKVSELGNSILYLTAKESSRRLDIEITFGQHIYTPDSINFRINPASIGSFNIDSDCDERRYFIAIGTILSNSGLHNALRGMLVDWHFEAKRLVESWKVIGNEISRRVKAALNEANHIAMMDHFNENIRPHFNQDLTNMWVLVDKKPADHMVNATYRKTPIRIISAPGDIYKISNIKNSYDRIQAINFAVIPAAKVKFID